MANSGASSRAETFRIDGTDSEDSMDERALKKAQDDFQLSMHMCFKQVCQTNARLDEHTHAIADIRRKQAEQYTDQDEMRDAAS
ncbi:unnamed protein product, partial [Prorocentrum cordatum]